MRGPVGGVICFPLASQGGRGPAGTAPVSSPHLLVLGAREAGLCQPHEVAGAYAPRLDQQHEFIHLRSLELHPNVR